VTLKLAGGVKLPSALIVPVASTVPLRESVTVRDAAPTGQVNEFPLPVQLAVAPGSIELQIGEPLLLPHASIPVRPNAATVTDRDVIVLGPSSTVNVFCWRFVDVPKYVPATLPVVEKGV
jgi:hypothetical protein